MPPRKTPQTPDQKAQVAEEQLPPLSDEAREAFNTGLKRTVVPRARKGEKSQPLDLIIRQFFTDQALEIMDQLEIVYRMVQGAANAQGNIDLMGIFRAAKEEVFTILLKALEEQIDRPTLGRLEIDDLLKLFRDVFNINADFFVHRVKDQLKTVTGQVSTMF